MNERQAHWEQVYATKSPSAVSWYRPHLERSLAFVDAAALDRSASIVDVGGGASTFVDDVLERGFRDVSVVDLSASALAESKARLGAKDTGVRWVVGDVLEVRFSPGSVDLWHDRAVFQFLRSDDERARYVAQLTAALKPGGHVVLGTFSLQGPDVCSGLPVARYDAHGLLAALGDGFELVDATDELHTTPLGRTQAFVYVHARKTAGARRAKTLEKISPE